MDGSHVLRLGLVYDSDKGEELQNDASVIRRVEQKDLQGEQHFAPQTHPMKIVLESVWMVYLKDGQCWKRVAARSWK